MTLGRPKHSCAIYPSTARSQNLVISIGIKTIGNYQHRFHIRFNWSQKLLLTNRKLPWFLSVFCVSCASYIASLLTIENRPFLPAPLVSCYWKTWITEPISLAIQMQTKTTAWQCKLTPKSISWTASAAVSWLNPFGALLIGQTAGKRTFQSSVEGDRGDEAVGPAWDPHYLAINKTVKGWWLPWPSSLSSLLLAVGRMDMWQTQSFGRVGLPQTLLLGLCVTGGGGMVSNHQHSTP